MYCYKVIEWRIPTKHIQMLLQHCLYEPVWNMITEFKCMWNVEKMHSSKEKKWFNWDIILWSDMNSKAILMERFKKIKETKKITFLTQKICCTKRFVHFSIETNHLLVGLLGEANIYQPAFRLNMCINIYNSYICVVCTLLLVCHRSIVIELSAQRRQKRQILLLDYKIVKWKIQLKSYK